MNALTGRHRCRTRMNALTGRYHCRTRMNELTGRYQRLRRKAKSLLIRRIRRIRILRSRIISCVGAAPCPQYCSDRDVHTYIHVGSSHRCYAPTGCNCGHCSRIKTIEAYGHVDRMGRQRKPVMPLVPSIPCVLFKMY